MKLSECYSNLILSDMTSFLDVINIEKTKDSVNIYLSADEKLPFFELLKLKKDIYKIEDKKIDIKIKYNEKLNIYYSQNDIKEMWENISEYEMITIPFGDTMIKNSYIEFNDNNMEVILDVDLSDYFYELGLNHVIKADLKNIFNFDTDVIFKKKNTLENKIQEQQLKKDINIKNNNENVHNFQDVLNFDIDSNIDFVNFEEENIESNNIENNQKFGINIEKKVEEKIENNVTKLDNESEKNNKYIIDSKTNSVKINKEVLNKIKKEEVKKQEPKEEDGDLPESGLMFGKNYKNNNDIKRSKIVEITQMSGDILIYGEAFDIETREIEKNNSVLYTIGVYDGTSSIFVKFFVKKDKALVLEKNLKKGTGLKIYGRANYDTFTKDTIVNANTIYKYDLEKKKKRVDLAPKKRIELACHTKMSMLEGIINIKDLITRAREFGMPAIGITDEGTVQIFPEVNKLTKDLEDFKALYGVDGYIVDDAEESVFDFKDQKIDTIYSVLDLETTGFSYLTEKITEIGILKINSKGEVLGKYETFVNPEKPIPIEVTKVTNITNEMVQDAPTIDKVIKEVVDFVGTDILVAHNADFDIGFLKYNAEKENLKLDNTYIDTLRLAKVIYPELNRFKLGKIADYLNIKVDVAHRALDDVKTLVQVFIDMIQKIEKKEIDTWENINERYGIDKDAYKKLFLHRIRIFAKNYVGLKNLYRLISQSHVNYFYQKPRILKSLIQKYKDGLLIGSGGVGGVIYEAILSGKSDDEIKDMMEFYDFIEILPLANAYKLYKKGRIHDRNQWNEINQKIIKLADDVGKKVVATGDVYLMEPEDKIYREIIQTGKKIRDAELQEEAYFRTTEEMLKEFEYLGEEKAKEVVIENTYWVADQIEKIEPISKVKCTPYIDGCEDDIRNIAYSKAHRLYGKNINTLIKERLDKELDSIISNGFAVLYILAQKLVWKSNEDGYMVGSRGSVGSSLVAYMLDISEVNPLPAHYRCSKCFHTDFEVNGIPNGVDLPDKKCPICGEELIKDGMNIPFETFLGFNGDKEPDIDLNFSGEYQAKAHRYTLEIIGDGNTYKAGTIGTIAEKTAFGYTLGYFENKEIKVNRAEILRLSKGCIDVKATTGQHPGGIIVLPAGHEIEEFTPIQRPADKTDVDIITTHFDYHSIEQNLLKLDMLGHDNPTILKMLEDITKIDPLKISLSEKKTMSIFSSDKALNIDEKKYPVNYIKTDFDGNKIENDVGTLGIPEFGTGFVQQMLRETRPTTFEELIRISGLSHGTDVWVGNAQELVKQGICTLSTAICTRDDIMIYLINKGLEKGLSFKIMESVRKGKGLNEDQEKEMRDKGVPDWYITSCKTIKYMFPKAHAAAYVTAAYRIAWYKVYEPKAFYSVFLSVKGEDFNALKMTKSYIDTLENYKQLLDKPKLTDKESKEKAIFEMVIEMYRRGLKFAPIDLYRSHYKNFLIEEDGCIRPPFNSIAGLGSVAAKNLYDAAQTKEFESIDDIKERGKVGDSVIEMLKSVGAISGIPQSSQLSLFDDFM